MCGLLVLRKNMNLYPQSSNIPVGRSYFMIYGVILQFPLLYRDRLTKIEKCLPLAARKKHVLKLSKNSTAAHNSEPLFTYLRVNERVYTGSEHSHISIAVDRILSRGDGS